MDEQLLNHYLKYSTFTNPACYKQFLQTLPNDIEKIGHLVSHQIIHRITLRDGNKHANKDLRYGDMNRFPELRLRCDDDILPTASSMIAELLRLDERGFKEDRKVEDKLVLTCRYVAILMASILKSKGIPCRVRSGFAPYFFETSGDHWINQYWNQEKNKWITFDADGFFDFLPFNQYDMPEEKFDWAAKVWLSIRNGKSKPETYVFAGGEMGLKAAIRAIIRDFHCLMNNEILYLQQPMYIANKFDTLTEKDFEEIDELAKVMLEPDKNFNALVSIWNTNKKFRILNSPLIRDDDHLTPNP
ncbi:MAG: transglutaminase domain-containing protein [Candidatus Woesearchaeota archaeon]|nr:transglutaminase domain-containing protein [Nanoarchaeota archaeon]USN44110.1 MAG: transglutaminase domain-containing protein [Candidatus Woesearchaeota archaeon]